MSKFKLPELPSDDELGITKEDREKYGDDASGEGELSSAELLALLGDASGSKPGARARPLLDAPADKKPGNDTGRAATVAAKPRGRFGRGPLTAALLIAMAVASSGQIRVPRPVEANAADTAFSSARAMSTITEVARRPHPPGSPEHARVRTYLLQRLRALGFEPEVQTTTILIERGPAVRAATVRNVVARLPGTQSSGALLITAHYDSRELSPGAGDNASGVATILEALRALSAGPPLRNDLIVLLTDAEELGLLGARAFVEEHAWLADVSVLLSFEMRGSGGPSIMFETNEQNGWIVRALADFDPSPFANSLGYEVYRRLPNDTDFTPFREAGKQGLNFAAIGRGHVYHQSTDTPENLSEATVQHHGLRALAALRWLGAADLSTVHAPNVVYFSVPLVGLIVYDPVWVLPITGGLVAALALLVWLARRQGARVKGMLAGLGVTVLSAALAYGVGAALLRWTGRFHPEAGSLSAALYHSEGWYVLGLGFAVLAVVVVIHGQARRWLRPQELTIGALVLPLVFAAVLSFAAPAGAMNVQWPVAAALLSALVSQLLGSRSGGTFGWIAALVFSLPVLMMLVPVIELLWMTLSIAQAPVLALLVAMVLYLCLPALAWLRQPNAWWAPVAALTLAGVAIGLGTLASRPSAARPSPTTLVYAYEHGAGSALWVTDPRADATLDSAAIAWAVAPVGSSFTATRDLTDFGYAGEFLVADAPVFPAAPPRVDLLSDVAEGAMRRVTLGVRSTIGAEAIRFQVDTNGGTRLVALNSRAIARPDSVEWAEHWGEPDSLIMLELTLTSGRLIGLNIVEHLHRPEEVVVADAFRRPPELAPDVSAMSDRAVLRSSAAALVSSSPPDTLPATTVARP